MNDRQLIVFDLDDTLVDTSHVYWLARQEFISILVDSGLDANLALNTFEDFDAKNIEKMGHAPERYEYTMLEVYRYLTKEMQIRESTSTEQKIKDAGRIICTRLPELINGAVELLDWTSTRFELVLLTRGAEELQMRKVANCGIGKYFKTVKVVEKKDASVLEAMIHNAGFKAKNSWVIGDSVRAEINPAIEIGAKPIWYIYTHHSYHWIQEHNTQPRQNIFEIRDLRDAIKILKDAASSNTNSYS